MATPTEIRQVVLIANPASGRGRGARAAAEAEDVFRKAGVRCERLETKQPGQAVELAGAVATRHRPDLLLVAGGDGTFRDVIAGLEGSPVPIGLLPCGTGNDLARTLGIPRNISQALHTALHGTPRPLDVWYWNETAFVNVAGIGLDAAVAAAVNRRFKRLRGTPAYLAAFLTVFPSFQPFELRLRWPEGEWAGAVWLAAFANAVSYGGGMRIAPMAVPDDGCLDLVIVEAVPRVELLREFPRIFSGAHVQNPRVRVLRVEQVEVSAAPQDATLDGELIGRTPARITRAPRPVNVMVPVRP